ncbi:YhjD/YihY/BrkB family envelope integrity protein [Dactylosporangium sp. NPDC049140]|uniref:YhjD/YihY/BrkB family envelope integrity protein n=1 Tax=Dactylosporangium sp. NPDC049140 TaxID=3155647 RepID=UPI0033E1ACC6
MIVRFVRLIARFFRGRDLNLHAAAVTFYSGIAVVPVALLVLRLAAALVGVGRVKHLAEPVLAAMPERMAAGAGVLVDAGAGMSWWFTFVALIPATLYGEGLRRALASLSGEPGGAAVGWRGRLLVLPLLACGPALVLMLLVALGAPARRLHDGGWATLWAVVLSFLIVWLVLSPVLILVYRLIAPLRPGWPVTVVVASFTAANISGFAHGFVLFWTLPLDLGAPFGGLDAVGATVAVGLWLYLFHLLTLVGYAATVQAHRMVLLRSAAQSTMLPN